MDIKDISITDKRYKSFKKVYEYAMAMTKKEIYQAVEGLYHNMNSLQSRSGNQLPFSSINYGTCTLEEGRMITKAILDVSLDGVGKFHRTSIFPCGIFQVKKGITDKGSKNYDLYKLAIKSTSKRLYPNYANCDWEVDTKGFEKSQKVKQEALDALTDEEKEKLVKLMEKDSSIGYKLGLKLVKEANNEKNSN